MRMVQPSTLLRAYHYALSYSISTLFLGPKRVRADMLNLDLSGHVSLKEHEGSGSGAWFVRP